MIKGTVKGGRLELNVPADWPDGTQVEIHPLHESGRGDADVIAAAEIAKTLSAMDRVEPFEMSDAEEAAWEAERRADRERQKKHFVEHSEYLRRMWD